MARLPSFFCPKPWESMTGDETCRFCSHCQKQVHNLSLLGAERQAALLASPAAELCGRYRAAIRRPAPGREVDYWKHLAKYGAGVATAGAALFVFWQADHAGVGPTEFVIGRLANGWEEMPSAYYHETETVLMGAIRITDDFDGPTCEPASFPLVTDAPFAPPPPRFRLTTEQVRALFAAPLPPPAIK